MTQYNPYGYGSVPMAPSAEGGELFDGVVIGADKIGDYDRTYTLLPEGDYPFTVVAIEASRFTPGPNSKIGACKQVTLMLRVVDPASGENVDLKHNLYCWNSKSTLGMIAQFFDAIGNHKKGEPINLDWRPEVIIGKTGWMKVNHRVNRDDEGKPAEQQRKYNNIQKLYKKDEPPVLNPVPGQTW